MIELFEQQLRLNERHSSKGNQLKWNNGNEWYKADCSGYEGLAEYVVSHLLNFSNIEENEFVHYELDTINYRGSLINGTKSNNMLNEDWQIITLERLFKNQYNESLYSTMWKIHGVKERLLYLCEQTIRITGMTYFGKYLTKLLTIDAFFLNEDRHTHNIAVLMNSKGEFKECPMFDHGACLLSDTAMDYPLDKDVFELMKSVESKTISLDFDEQLNAAEELFGQQIHFSFNKSDVDRILAESSNYSSTEIERVKAIVYEQMRKYVYLFS